MTVLIYKYIDINLRDGEADNSRMKINISTAIVSGAAGFVGYHLVQRLQEKGIFVVALCRPDSAHNERLRKFNNLKILECDTSDFMKLKNTLGRYSPNAFFHLAWEGTTGEKRGDYTVQLTNVKNTCDAYLCAAEIGCKKFVAAGTIYEKLMDQILFAENFSPLSYYVLAKHFAYESLFQLSKKTGLDWTWCLFCQPIGRYIKLNQLMAYLVMELKEGRKPLLGTAENPFDMIAVEDLAEGLYLAAEHRLGERRYYIGSGTPRRLREYLTCAGDIISPTQKLIFGERPDDGLRFSYEWLDVQPFQEETGFKSKHSFEDSINAVALWVDECRSTGAGI